MQGGKVRPPGKEHLMIIAIFILMAIIFMLGVIAETNRDNKRTFCYCFIACVILVALLERGQF